MHLSKVINGIVNGAGGQGAGGVVGVLQSIGTEFLNLPRGNHLGQRSSAPPPTGGTDKCGSDQNR